MVKLKYLFCPYAGKRYVFSELAWTKKSGNQLVKEENTSQSVNQSVYNEWKANPLGDHVVPCPYFPCLANRILLRWLVRVSVPVWSLYWWHEEPDSLADEGSYVTILSGAPHDQREKLFFNLILRHAVRTAWHFVKYVLNNFGYNLNRAIMEIKLIQRI